MKSLSRSAQRSQRHTFVGFGFGAIQAGLFLYEAWRSGNFDRLFVAEVIPSMNHNHAAEILAEALELRLGGRLVKARTQVLNTVIGKMSGVVNDPVQIAEQGLRPVVPGMPRVFLVEEFNRILITRIGLSGFQRGIEVFEEKADLLPFEEASCMDTTPRMP
jgi:hypothetical protein